MKGAKAMMGRTKFEQTLRHFLDRKPFKPFVIEMDDGSHWQVDRRERLNYYVGDTAWYFEPGPNLEFAILDCENVREIIDAPSP